MGRPVARAVLSAVIAALLVLEAGFAPVAIRGQRDCHTITAEGESIHRLACHSLDKG